MNTQKYVSINHETKKKIKKERKKKKNTEILYTTSIENYTTIIAIGRENQKEQNKNSVP